MEFEKYQHVERLGTTETEGILNGVCYIFPKIDGTNASVWIDDDNKVQAGSRKRHLSLDKDNADFLKWVSQQQNIESLLLAHRGIRLFGEWLVPHSLLTYRDDAWRRFYVFDVTYNGHYMKYDEYKKLLDEYSIDYIPPICYIENPSKDAIYKQLPKNTFLIKDGHGQGEGIVIKNYEYVNKYGRQTWAKIVTSEFKDKFHKDNLNQVKDKTCVEDMIVMNYVTTSLIDKEFAKIDNEVGWTSKMIPRLFSTVFYCLITEEAWNFIKKYKNPTIDFSLLYNRIIQKIKLVKPELF